MSLLSECDKGKSEMPWNAGVWGTWLGIYLWKNCLKHWTIENLPVSPINLRFLENDKSFLAKTFIENKAKFHRFCGNKFSDLKLERAQKSVKKRR